MYKTADFLKKYKTIIFDMDGVITHEQQYWNAAALTVWEYLRSAEYCGSERLDAAKMSADTQKIRDRIFINDKFITLLKSKGVNSNWDLGYVTFAYITLADGDIDAAFQAAESSPENILDEYPRLGEELSQKLGINCRRNGKLWLDMQNCFQEWFLGDELFEKIYGKKPRLLGKTGLCHSETPLIDSEKLCAIFSLLASGGVKIGIATGRPDAEMKTPLESFKIANYISKNSMISYDYVVGAERAMHQNFTKPHPYMFLKAMLGKDYPDSKIAVGDYPKDGIKSTLAVGDAAADFFAAHAAGMDFCAVLTGISGKKAKGFFEKEGAEYILDSLENFLK